MKVELTLQVSSQEHLSGHLRELRIGLIALILFSSLYRAMDLPSCNMNTIELSNSNVREILRHMIEIDIYKTMIFNKMFDLIISLIKIQPYIVTEIENEIVY